MVSGKTTKGQKVGLVLDLVVVGWVFFALSSVFTQCLKPATISKVIGSRAHHSSCFCRCCWQRRRLEGAGAITVWGNAYGAR